MRVLKLTLLASLALVLSVQAQTIDARRGQVAGRAAVAVGASGHIAAGAPHAHFHAVFRDRQGRVVAVRDATNMVTRGGCSLLITDALKAGTGPALYVGEIKTYTSFATTDDLSSHAGWTAIIAGDITDGTLPALTLGAVNATTDTVSADNSASKATFHQNTTMSVFGFYITDTATKGAGAGVIYGEATFTEAPVASGYTVDVTVTTTTTAG